MSKKKKTKHTFSKEEKELIQKMKHELRFMGIPRDQWSLYIQKELRGRRKSKDFRSSKFMSKIKDGFDKTVGKVGVKALGKVKDQTTGFEDFFEQGSQGEMDFMKMVFSDIKFDNIDDLGKHGTTLKEVPQKKKMVVDLDLYEDDD